MPSLMPSTVRPARDDIADVDVFALQPHGLHHAVQQLARAAHEGQALFVLVGARPLAHEYQLRVRIPLAKYDRLTRGSQFAAAAVAEVLTNLLQRLRAGTRRRGGLK